MDQYVHRRAKRAIVLAPYIEREGRLESPHYDLPEYREEIAGWMRAVGLAWEWRVVTVASLESELDRAAALARDGVTLVFNLCDGTEADGYPGVEVVDGLEERAIPYTGAGPQFYRVTTSKAASKSLFVRHGVPTAPYRLLRDACELDAAIAQIGFPLFIKPDVSAGSYGVQVDSVCYDRAAAAAKIAQVRAGLHGQNFADGGVLAEAFIEGREFTVLLVEDERAPRGLRALPACERVFDARVPTRERFLAFERYWELPEENRPLPPGEPYYWYALAPAGMQGELADLSRRAMRAVGGESYARVDIRRDERTGAFHVLEVNAQCGLSSDDSATVGSMLRLCRQPIAPLIESIFGHAMNRGRVAAPSFGRQRVG